jgi:hypothetical protein
MLLTVPARAGTFSAFGPKVYTRQTGAPVTVTDSFTVLNPNTQYTLHLVNGGLQDDTADFVSSATVTVNGVLVIAPQDLNQHTTTIDRPVQLQANNSIAVELHGKPGGQLAIQFVGVDNDPPTISALASPAANAASWNNSNVNVSFTCADAISGVTSCSAPVVVAAEGAGQVITGMAVDLAGNTATASVTLNIDKTPPSLAVSSPVNGASVSGPSLTVTGTVTDALSGVAGSSLSCNGVPASVTGASFSCIVPLVSGLNNLSVTATDVAGNTATKSLTVTTQLASPTQHLQAVQVSPQFVNAGQSVTITASVRVDVDRTLIPSSITLYRVDDQDQVVESVGQMFDDGTHGDALKGDNIFSTTVTLNEATPEIVFFRASASYQGLATPVFSDFARVFVQSTQTAEQALAALAAAIQGDNISTALKFFPPSPKTTDTLTNLNSEQRSRLVGLLNSLVLVSADDQIRVYHAPWVEADGTTTQVEFGLGRDLLGNWLIFSW